MNSFGWDRDFHISCCIPFEFLFGTWWYLWETWECPHTRAGLQRVHCWAGPFCQACKLNFLRKMMTFCDRQDHITMEHDLEFEKVIDVRAEKFFRNHNLLKTSLFTFLSIFTKFLRNLFGFALKMEEINMGISVFNWLSNKKFTLLLLLINSQLSDKILEEFIWENQGFCTADIWLTDRSISGVALGDNRGRGSLRDGVNEATRFVTLTLTPPPLVLNLWFGPGCPPPTWPSLLAPPDALLDVSTVISRISTAPPPLTRSISQTATLICVRWRPPPYTVSSSVLELSRTCFNKYLKSTFTSTPTWIRYWLSRP